MQHEIKVPKDFLKVLTNIVRSSQLILDDDDVGPAHLTINAPTCSIRFIPVDYQEFEQRQRMLSSLNEEWERIKPQPLIGMAKYAQPLVDRLKAPSVLERIEKLEAKMTDACNQTADLFEKMDERIEKLEQEPENCTVRNTMHRLQSLIDNVGERSIRLGDLEKKVDELTERMNYTVEKCGERGRRLSMLESQVQRMYYQATVTDIERIEKLEAKVDEQQKLIDMFGECLRNTQTMVINEAEKRSINIGGYPCVCDGEGCSRCKPYRSVNT